MKKIVFLFSVLAVVCTVNAQVTLGKNPRALLSFNSAKTGEVNIDYNTSFLIADYSLDDATKASVEKSILQKDNTIKEVKLADVDQKKGLYITVNFYAKDKKELTEKMRFILNEIGVQQVEYNGTVFKTLKEFAF